ncbi:hypothetical protein GA0115240_115013 [Streptomyces sp. DvalAA-14]|nr:MULTISPECIES: hypothetical protein [unclassified Streptomyces]MYS19955.1 hypothetical protein [Streptomyces sp. SID4948]SCD57313.1 hypothetical protein GA0115240_115013 [Streptomyces sp. DvalAA-14]
MGIDAGVRNLYKKRLEGQYTYSAPGVRRARAQDGRRLGDRMGKATKT